MTPLGEINSNIWPGMIYLSLLHEVRLSLTRPLKAHILRWLMSHGMSFNVGSSNCNIT